VALSLHQARSVYDRIGRIQDWQAFYEDATINRLVANAALAGDQTIFEFGCGTGRLAARLLGALPPTVNYLGVDISPVMINLATGRLAAWAGRAKVVLVDGSLPLPADDGPALRRFDEMTDATFRVTERRSVRAFKEMSGAPTSRSDV